MPVLFTTPGGFYIVGDTVTREAHMCLLFILRMIFNGFQIESAYPR